MIANRSEIADIFGVAKTTVDTWRKRGCPILEANGKGVPSKYDTVEVHKWLAGGNVDEDFSKLLDEEKHRKLKRENDIEDNLVAPVSVLTVAIEKVATQIIPILDSLPLEMKRRNPNLTGHDIQLVKKTIARTRNIISEINIMDEDVE